MAASLVERATNEALIGPDWNLYMEICDIINQDPGQAKDIIKAMKKRIGNKNTKVQFLALMLLETLVKNCGDVVHMLVAEKDLLHDMVKMAKKKQQPDYNVKDKILVLIDTWQDAFGGPRARYPQYYAAYQELLRAGVVFPQRPENSAPIFTPPQTQPLQHYPAPVRSPDYQEQIPEVPSGPEVSSLSLKEIQNAREIMEVLSEMLNAMDPRNRGELKQEVLVDLVGQCRSYKSRVLKLVNSTANEKLLSQGLALNDDLERVLAKHDAIAAGVAFPMEKPKPSAAFESAGDSSSLSSSKVAANKEPNAPDQRSSSENAAVQSPFENLALPAPPVSSTSAATLESAKPIVDLLSGDDFVKPSADNGILITSTSSPVSLASDQNILALSDMFPQNNIGNSRNGSAIPLNSLESSISIAPTTQVFPAPSVSPFPALQPQPQPQPQLQQPAFHSDRSNTSSTVSFRQVSQQNRANSSWDGPQPYGADFHPQQIEYGMTGGQDEVLPPPPWETQPAGSDPINVAQVGAGQPPFMPVEQLHSMPQSNVQFHGGPITILTQQIPGGQYGGAYQQPFYGGQFSPYGNVPQPEAYYGQGISPYGGPPELSYRMYGLSMQDNSSFANSHAYQPPTASTPLQQYKKPPKPEDNLFGDLVNIAKSKPKKA